MILKIAWKNIIHKPLAPLLSWILLSASVAIISVIALMRDQFEQQFEANISDIDMVMGAKGSPMQLILSAIYHIDYPTGNIDYATAQRWMNHKMVKMAIPLSYGDAYKGYRILGTTPAYLEKYNTGLAEGRVYQSSFEVVVGAKAAEKLKMHLGMTFLGTHGLAEQGEEHEEHPYTVVGILSPTGAVVDNLIISNLESVWAMHQHEAENAEEEDKKLEITAVLLQFRSPMALLQWPRMIAENTEMQLASPALEINRLFSIFGIGLKALAYLGYAIMFLSGISVFISLFNTLRDRRYELALMRTMGAGRRHLLWLILLESWWLCLAGFLSGIFLSRLALWIISNLADSNWHLRFDQMGIRWQQELQLLGITLGIGLMAALVPAIKAFRLNISETLANN